MGSNGVSMSDKIASINSLLSSNMSLVPSRLRASIIAVLSDVKTEIQHMAVEIGSLREKVAQYQKLLDESNATAESKAAIIAALDSEIKALKEQLAKTTENKQVDKVVVSETVTVSTVEGSTPSIVEGG